MGKKNADEMQFWTKDEFAILIGNKYFADKPESKTVFMTLYYIGMREGKLFALTPSDINLDKKEICINKSLQRIGKTDLVTTPKTPKSNRTITINSKLCDCLREYLSMCYELKPNDRLFPFTKNFLYREMERATKASSVKRIRVHDIRHSHASLLIELGFSPLLIAERLGHEKVQTTLDTYGHLYPNKQVAVANKLDEI